MPTHHIFVFCLLSVTATSSAFAQAASNPVSATASKTVVLDPFTVTSQLDEAREDIVPSLGAAEYHLDKSQIDALPLGGAAGFNQVLLRAPGMAEDSFGQVHLRGEHANLQYRINDVLLPEGISGFGQELDTRFVGSVNVLTGTLPAQYGYRTAGVVDIHTQNGTAPPGGDLTLYGGSFNTRRASAEAFDSHDNLTGYATASDETSDLGIENPTGSRHALHDHTDQFKAFGYFSDVLDATSRVSLLLSGSFAHFQVPDNPGQDPAFTLNGRGDFDSAALNENQREENAYAIAAYQKSAGDVSLQLSAFTRYSLVHFTPDHDGDLIFNGVASDVDRNIVSHGFEADARWSVAATHTVRGGALVTATNAGTRTTTSVFPADDDGNQTSDVPFDIADNHRKLGWLYSAYLQDEWTPAGGLTINYGLRADASRAYLDESQLSPRINVVYQLGDATSLHAGYAHYFTPPPLELVQTSSLAKFTGTTNESALATSSPVRSERADYFDAGVTRKFTPGFSVTLDGYSKRATDLLDEGQFGQALIFSPFNYAQGRIHGVELSANYTHEGFSAYGNLALSRATARQIVSGEFQFEPDELAYIAAHDVHLDHDQLFTASAGASYRFAGTLVYADVLYGSGLRRGFANASHLPAYHPVNLGAQHTFKLKPGHELIARFEIMNVFDEVYALRDGSGIGVGAPQFGSRRGFFGTLTLTL